MFESLNSTQLLNNLIHIPGLVEKIGDIKLNRQVTSTLLAIADAISLNFTSANACIYAEKQKSPKVHTEVSEIIWNKKLFKLY